MDTAEKQKGVQFKPIYAVAILVAIVAVIGIVAYMTISSGASSAAVVAGDNVSVYYTGSFTNGTVFDSNVGRQPINFTVGAGQLIQGFDQAVVGMKLNETKTVTIPPAEGYGPVNQSLIMNVSTAEFGNQIVTVGMGISTNTGRQGRVTAVNGNMVTVNLNSPLAGQTLIFKIQVVAIHPK
jgi:peptidylprolyl isomerase